MNTRQPPQSYLAVKDGDGHSNRKLNCCIPAPFTKMAHLYHYNFSLRATARDTYFIETSMTSPSGGSSSSQKRLSGEKWIWPLPP